jgi:tripartite-type tricarboxylate transporter receptor subunit TctC
MANALCRLAFGCAAALLCATALAQYPSKPIRFVVPYPPGGPTDILARPLAQKMQEDWGQPVIVESKPGASGNIGTHFVEKAPPDGYTVVMGAIGPLASGVTLYPDLPYHPLTDLAPVVHVASVPLLLIAHPAMQVSSTGDVIALSRQKPGQLAFANAGAGSPQHLTAEMFKLMAKVDISMIPYKGAAPALADVAGGHVPFMFDSMISSVGPAKSGRVRAIAVTSAQRVSLLPEVPTMRESGVPDFDATAWYGVMAPAGTPKEIIAKLNDEMVKVLKTPEMRQRLAEMGSDFVAGPPEEFGRFIKAEIAKWGKVVKDSGARAD